MLQEFAYTAILLVGVLLAIPYGRFLSRVFRGEPNLLTPIFRPVEKQIYKICGIDENTEMTWRRYILVLMGFEFLCMIFLFMVLELQGLLPLNPQGLGPLRWDTAFQTAISFPTNTQWSSYAGERDFSYMSQMLGIMVQDYISPAVGFVAIIVLARSFSRKNSPTVGNFWVDLVRVILYAWVPLSLILVWPLIYQGVIMNFNPYVVAHTLEGQEQLIPGGPAAVITLFKMMCEDGGCFFSTSSAYPFENPTPLTNWLEMGYILFVPAAIVVMIGELARSRATTVALFSVMALLFILSIPLPFWAETQGNPILENVGVQGGLNMEGKEMRFTMFENLIFIVTAMTPANGTVINQQDSLLPLTIMQIIFNIVIGAPIFGCIGEGSLAMMHYFIIAMFIAGLMTGRTPEMIGKKLELREIILASVSFLTSSFSSLVTAAFAVMLPVGLASIGNPGPHGLTEVLYAFTSASINNGSYLSGLNVNTPFYNILTVFCMPLGRYSTLLVGIAIAGSMARKGQIPISAASLPIASPLFIVTVVFVVVVLSTLAFFPVLMLTSVLEHLFMQAGVTF